MKRRALALARLGFDRITIYLPIILMGALALGTYWLVRNAPRLLENGAAKPAVHEPDYFMRDFVLKNFLPNGELRSELSGKEGRHYPDTDTFEVDDVRVRSVSPEGLVTRASARRGVSNADATEVQLFGNAVVVREAGTTTTGRTLPRMEFRGEFLHAFLDTDRVTSNKPVTLIRAGNSFTADQLDYDHRSGVAELQGRVRGQLVPGRATAPSGAAP